MKQSLFLLPFAITAYGFDERCRGYPSRVELGGITIRASKHIGSSSAYFCDDNLSFWLKRKGNTWYAVIQAVTN